MTQLKKLERLEKLNEFHYHEALDRTYCVIETIDRILLEHAVFEHKELESKVRKAIEQLSDVYLMIGDIDCE